MTSQKANFSTQRQSCIVLYCILEADPANDANTCLSRQAYFCRDKHTFVATSILLSRQAHIVETSTLLSRQAYFCRDKHTFVATDDVFCFVFVVFSRENFVETKLCLSQQNYVCILGRKNLPHKTLGFKNTAIKTHAHTCTSISCLHSHITIPPQPTPHPLLSITLTSNY